MMRLEKLARTALRRHQILHRLVSTCTSHPPHPSAARSLALPIVFLSVKGWSSSSNASASSSPLASTAISSSSQQTSDDRTLEACSNKGDELLNVDGWKVWKEAFNERGYTCLTVVVDPSSETEAHSESSTDLLNRLEADLKDILGRSGSPYPPLLIASHHATLLAQTYVSSHPLTALLLSSPTHPPRAYLESPHLFSTDLAVFDYEPRFPIGIHPVLARQGEAEEERLLAEVGERDEDGAEDSLVSRLKGGKDAEGWVDAMEWMDDNGI